MASSEVNLNLNNTNIRQINSKDIKDFLDGDISKVSQISVDNTPTIITVNGVTSAATKQYDVIYATLLLDKEGTQKFGYSCDEVARKFPIYAHFDDQPDGLDNKEKEWSVFYIGKTGMLEIQPEEYKNVNGTDYDDINGRTYSVRLQEVRIPYKYKLRGGTNNG